VLILFINTNHYCRGPLPPNLDVTVRGANNIITNNVVAFTGAFNLATYINLLTHYAKGTPLALKPLNAYRIY